MPSVNPAPNCIFATDSHSIGRWYTYGEISSIIGGIPPPPPTVSIRNVDGSIILSPNPILGTGTVGLNPFNSNQWRSQQNFYGASIRNGNSILFNGPTDQNWRIGIDSSFTCTNIATNASLQVTVGAGSGGPDGFAIGQCCGGVSIAEFRGYDLSSFFMGPLNVAGPVQFESLAGSGDGFVAVDNAGNLTWSAGGGISTPTLQEVTSTGAITNVGMTIDGSTGNYFLITGLGNCETAIQPQLTYVINHGNTRYIGFDAGVPSVPSLFWEDSNNFRSYLAPADTSSAYSWTLPSQSGTVALLSDVGSSTLDNILTNGNTSTNSINLNGTGGGFGTTFLGGGNIVTQSFSDGGHVGIEIRTTNDGSDNYIHYYHAPHNGYIVSGVLTDDRTWTLPDNTGTFALLSDITAPNLDAVLTTGNTSANYVQIVSAAESNTIEYNKTTISNASYGLRIDTNSLLFSQSGVTAQGILSVAALTTSSARTWNLPDKSGTVAMLSDLLHIDSVPQYADDATAIGAGLVTGDLYSTTTLGSTFLKIVP